MFPVFTFHCCCVQGQIIMKLLKTFQSQVLSYAHAQLLFSLLAFSKCTFCFRNSLKAVLTDLFENPLFLLCGTSPSNVKIQETISNQSLIFSRIKVSRKLFSSDGSGEIYDQTNTQTVLLVLLLLSCKKLCMTTILFQLFKKLCQQNFIGSQA